MSRHHVFFFFLLFIVFIFASLVLAHEENNESVEVFDALQERSVLFIVLVSFSSFFLVIIALLWGSHLTEPLKWFLFLGISIPVLLVTCYAAGATVYQNYISESKGPVHWHADFEIWNCGQQVDLLDPTGLTNRIGTPLFHEHNDQRIHVEGTLRAREDVSLHHFFEVIGGYLDSEHLVVPTDEGTLSLMNDGVCNGNRAEVQVFLYRVQDAEAHDGYSYSQTKLSDFENLVLSSNTQVPPGDCFIIEYDAPKDRTDKVCESYRLAQEQGTLREFDGR